MSRSNLKDRSSETITPFKIKLDTVLDWAGQSSDTYCPIYQNCDSDKLKCVINICNEKFISYRNAFRIFFKSETH